MDKDTLNRLTQRLPKDATEISIPHHDSRDLIFNSDIITVQNAHEFKALPAQRGSYRGFKKRWRIQDEFSQSMVQPNAQEGKDTAGGTPINLSDIPYADETNR